MELFVLFLVGVGTVHADSNPTITVVVDAFSKKALICTSDNGNVIRIKGVSGELRMSAKFATDGYDAENDDEPSNFTERTCEVGASSDSDSGGMAIVNVSTTKLNQTELI